MIASYFDLPEVSTSDLKALERSFYAKLDPFQGDRTAIEFGSLVDALLEDKARQVNGWPETGRIKYATFGLADERGVIHHYQKAVWDKAVLMAAMMANDQVVAPLMRVARPQYVFRRTLTFDYDGTEYQIRGRCMFDLYADKNGIGLDYKMLAIRSRKELIASIDHFDYDMQAAYYMDLARIDYHWIVAGSKPKEKVYHYAIERGDAVYTSGREKWNRWAYYWITLIENFNQPTI